jgi:hypothetical protein
LTFDQSLDALYFGTEGVVFYLKAITFIKIYYSIFLLIVAP